MTSKFTREELLNIIETDHVQCGESSALARMALAAMDSEPVAEVLSSRPGNDTSTIDRALPVGTQLYRHAQPAKGLELAGWQFKSVNGDWLGLIDEHGKNQAVREGCEVREVSAMADGVNDRDQVRREHAEWSQATFGNVGPIGPLKHLSKEALEAAAEPCDLSEWADMQFLLWDAQRRAGITDDQITQAMIEKLEVNKQREWPEPKDGEPRLHIKEQPAPVVTFYRDGIEAAAKWIDQQREAYDSEHGRHDLDTGSFEFGNDAQREYSSTLEELAEGIRALHPNAGNSPVIPDGYRLQPISEYEAMCATVNSDEWPQRWIPVSEQMPENDVSVLTFDGMYKRVHHAMYGHWQCWGPEKITHWMRLPAAPQEVK
ncbi:DUF550 domain-containing protein [Klebsiella pneumoniae]|nr:DUF550 domain-containing protein [Klebsiella pneumoniae]ELA2539224.1 DUF550 domain-containing protein [Klebsiella pneumoniae]MCI7927777.1 DUF550 domain-containing protein [Klebsiella pneumoniae]MCI7932893.1 DUF550 domain-containing protein [Klebsiella pneumoniae]